jgi:hypothetical protein
MMMKFVRAAADYHHSPSRATHHRRFTTLTPRVDTIAAPHTHRGLRVRTGHFLYCRRYMNDVMPGAEMHA